MQNDAKQISQSALGFFERLAVSRGVFLRRA